MKTMDLMCRSVRPRYRLPTAAAMGLCLATAGSPAMAQSIEQRTSAATTTTAENPYCTALSKFYWEIGDATGKLAGGTRGSSPPAAGDQMAVYSASKWIYGAYVYERRSGVLDDELDKPSLTMTAGYTDGGSCLFNTTVSSCYNTIDGHDPDADGEFYYAPGHFQEHAVNQMGLGSKNKSQLATEIHAYLGSDFVFTYNQPQLAGGGRSSATDYAKFLRKMLDGTLRLSGTALGSDAICTYTSATDSSTGRTHCDAALYSPADDPAANMSEAWSYSMGHWVETDPVEGDGAFSSPGAAGFYPWIDASKTYYGILARYQLTATSSADSVKCGRRIREAWLTGTAQLD